MIVHWTVSECVRHTHARDPIAGLSELRRGCCGIYFGLFVVGSLILSAIGVNASKRYGTAVAGIAVAAAIIGAIAIVWLREKRRTERVVALDRDRAADRHVHDERLREIEAELGANPPPH